MPNWVENDLTVSGPKERLEEFKQRVAGDEEPLDAGKIIPYPPVFALLDRLNSFVGRQAEPTKEDSKLLLESALQGYDTHKDGYNQGGYEWCRDNWGTKWNFSEVSGPVLEVRPRVCKLYYSFETAWSPPTPLIRKMGEIFPDLSFKLVYWEGGAGYQGVFCMRNGRVTKDENRAYSGSKGG